MRRLPHVNRAKKIGELRATLKAGGATVGSWMQIPHASIAEIMGQAGYDWVALDLEHGAIGAHQLPDLCRALELGDTLPLVRVAEGTVKDCKLALDAGAGGIIAPMVESAKQLLSIASACRWPPTGTRGVGFSRANLFGKHFQSYSSEAQAPVLVAMIEHHKAVDDLEAILAVPGLDAILIGPYDLSASIGHTGEFSHPQFESLTRKIKQLCGASGVACGMHVVAPSPAELQARIAEGFRFLAYSIDSVFLNQSAARPVS